MNRDDALKEVTDLGIAYFQDWISDFETTALAVDSIFKEIKDHASRSKPTGSSLWETREEAVRVALQEIQTNELDQILEYYYSLEPMDVGGSKAFFESLHTALVDGVNSARHEI
jgi:hypothetical protein